jgi:hypothetical protein
MCESPDHRADRCPQVTDREYLDTRPSWTAAQQAVTGKSRQALDQQWRRENGYCNECPRRSVKPLCRSCAAKKAWRPSRDSDYRRARGDGYTARSRAGP